MDESLSAHSLTRRQLVKRGALGALLLVVAGGGASFFWPTRRRGAPGALRVFDEAEASILAAVAEAVLAIEPGAPSAESVGVVARVDALLARSGPDVQRELARLLRLFENGLTGLATGSGWTSFTAASDEARRKRLAAWETSRISIFRTGYQAMKRLASACYYSSPAAWGAIGYPGPPEVPS